MSTKRAMRYQMMEVEIRKLPEELVVPEDASGIGVVLRLDDKPVGFFLEALEPGTRIERKELARRIFKHAGEQIISERIYEELRGKLDCRGFPALDVAICTHNRPDTLARCLSSLEATGVLGSPGVRILVIDNAPPDDRTARIVNQFAGVIYIREPKPGLDFARNRALDEATGELLAFLDDDVAIDCCWLEGLREAWAANPDSGGFLGPILPLELETEAQIIFEKMGGFGKSFARVRFGSELPESPTYPCGAGIFGAGANMVLRTSVLRELGGFDDALDTGAPLPGGGDLDIYYRIIRAGHPLVREPKMVVYHQHRREYKSLRHQMWTWGLGTMAYVTKSWRSDPEQRPKIRRWLLWWLSYQLSKVLVPTLRRNRVRWPVDLVLAEILGAVVGLCGEYDRSENRIERLRRRYA